MFGPSEVLHFPKDLALSSCGICLVAFTCSLIFVPLLSEIVEAVMEKEQLLEATEDLNDLAAGFFNTAYAVGCLIAPILGGLFDLLYGFRFTCDIMGFSSAFFAVVFFFISVVPYLLTLRKFNKQKKLMDTSMLTTPIKTTMNDVNKTVDTFNYIIKTS